MRPLLAVAVSLVPCARCVAHVHVASMDPGSVVVSPDSFRERLRGRTFQRWSDFRSAAAAGASAAEAQDGAHLEGGKVGSEATLMSGLSLAFVFILNVLVFTSAFWIFLVWNDSSPRLAGWLIFLLLCVYGFLVNAYCYHAYEYPKQRLVTNFIFGLVPLAVSSASYFLALIILDIIYSVGDGVNNPFKRPNPWEERIGGRFIFFLAVLPGLAVSSYLSSTVSTGFEAAATHFDILSLCLFIDVGRFFGHLSYLVAREWSIGKSPTSISSRPGLCYVFLLLCCAWYFILARLQVGGIGFIHADRTKIYTLACLTSFVFFPLSLIISIMNVTEFFDSLEEHMENARTVAILLTVFLIAVVMLLLAVIFDAIEPNLMGIAAILWVVFYGAGKGAGSSIPLFVCLLVPFSALAFGATVLSSQYAPSLRNTLLTALALI